MDFQISFIKKLLNKWLIDSSTARLLEAITHSAIVSLAIILLNSFSLLVSWSSLWIFMPIAVTVITPITLYLWKKQRDYDKQIKDVLDKISTTP